MIARYEVKGNSMLPSFREGDRLLVWKTRTVREGDVVVFQTPERDCVKRIAKVAGDGIHMKGDNGSFSTDSRHYGAIRKEKIVGKVLVKY